MWDPHATQFPVHLLNENLQLPALARRGDCAAGAVGAVGQRRKYLMKSVRFAEIYADAARL